MDFGKTEEPHHTITSPLFIGGML